MKRLTKLLAESPAPQQWLLHSPRHRLGRPGTTTKETGFLCSDNTRYLLLKTPGETATVTPFPRNTVHLGKEEEYRQQCDKQHLSLRTLALSWDSKQPQNLVICILPDASAAFTSTPHKQKPGFDWTISVTLLLGSVPPTAFAGVISKPRKDP